MSLPLLDPPYRLIFLAFFFVLFALLVLLQQFAVRIEGKAPLFAIFVDDSFIVRALFFPANDFAALGLRLGSLLHRSRDIRAADGAFFFVFLRLRGNAEGESGADGSYC